MRIRKTYHEHPFFFFLIQENMAQPDPLSLTLRDFITLSQLCFHLTFLGSLDPTSSN